MRTLLVTVGTSLITNARRDLGREPEGVDLALYLKATEPARASAEANSIFQLLRIGAIEERDKLIFLHSQTKEGRLCAEVLKSYYESKSFQAELVGISDLTYEESRFKMRGLKQLVAAMMEIIERERGGRRECAINATGGFKAEIAYATLVGLLLNMPVYYIHEAFQEIIEMPPTSIGWDYSLIFYYEEFFDWINSDLRGKEEVDGRLKAIPEEDRRKIAFLLTEEEGFTMLSPAGEAFYRSYRSKAEKPDVKVLLSKRARETLEESPLDLRKKFSQVIMRVGTELRCVASEAMSGGVRVFPKGHRDERLFYYEKEGKVHILELSRHSDGSYPRLRAEFEKGSKTKEEYEEFSPSNQHLNS